MEFHRSKRLKLVLTSIILIALCALVFVYLAYRRSIAELTPVIAEVKADGKIALEQIRQSASKDGRTQWSLDAKAVSYDHEHHRATFDEPQVTYFVENDEPVQLTAKRGVVETDSKDMSISGGIEMQQKKYRMRTDKLRYSHAQRRIEVETPVTISGDTFEVKANGMHMELDNKRAFFTGNVTGIFHEKVR